MTRIDRENNLLTNITEKREKMKTEQKRARELICFMNHGKSKREGHILFKKMEVYIY